MAKITKVLKGSVLAGKVKKGDDVVAFGEHRFEDILDYIYADSLPEGTVSVQKNGQTVVIDYCKENEYDTLGLEFDDSIEIVPRECHNNCIFCFVQQLPEGMRDTLYIKDDDYRLSFISGSYITCTNLREEDMQRILEYKLSPLYVSVHATDEDVRKYLLGIKRCTPQMEQLKRLIGGGIMIHAQIVLVGGINDGDILRKSLKDLREVGVETVAVVPVGLTEHREGKKDIHTLTKEQAADAVDIVESFYKQNIGFCYCSDEMYQIAGRKVPDASYYGEYEQIENGVGLISKFIDELKYALTVTKEKHIKRSIGIFTGVSGESTMVQATKLVEEKFPGIKFTIYVVKNDFFGRTVTVTGLVTATDILNQYGGKEYEEDFFMIPSVMMKEFENVFLDGTDLKTLQKKMGKKILVAKCTGDDFLRVVLSGRSSK